MSFLNEKKTVCPMATINKIIENNKIGREQKKEEENLRKFKDNLQNIFTKYVKR